MGEEWIKENESQYSKSVYRKYKPIEFKAIYQGKKEKLDFRELCDMDYHRLTWIYHLKDEKQKQEETIKWKKEKETNPPVNIFYRIKPSIKIAQGAFMSCQLIDVPESDFPTELKLKANEEIIVKCYFWEIRDKPPRKRPYINVLKITRFEGNIVTNLGETNDVYWDEF